MNKQTNFKKVEVTANLEYDDNGKVINYEHLTEYDVNKILSIINRNGNRWVLDTNARKTILDIKRFHRDDNLEIRVVKYQDEYFYVYIFPIKMRYDYRTNIVYLCDGWDGLRDCLTYLT